MIVFDEPIFFGRFLSRYKRFFMDVALDSQVITAHTPNTGSMLGLLHENNRVLLTKSPDKNRKLSFTAQAIEVSTGSFVGINTHMPNKLILKSLKHPLLADFSGYQSVKKEVPFGPDLRSRVDFLFFDDKAQNPPLYLEVKSVTLRIGDKAQFPDTVSKRAQKHIEDLLFIKKQGFKAGLLFIVQRTDCTLFAPACHIDNAYGEMLFQARDQGIFIKALSACIDEQGISLVNELPIVF